MELGAEFDHLSSLLEQDLGERFLTFLIIQSADDR
jgi:hypothetical protein